jgi:hypothetical protein
MSCCSYCRGSDNDHRSVSGCPFNVQDRALHIFNESIDPEPHKITTYFAKRQGNRYIMDGSGRNTITLSRNNEENQLWFKDSQGRSPSDENWNLVKSQPPSEGEFSTYEILNTRYRRIVELLLKFHDLKFRPHLGHVTCSVTYMKRPDIPKVRRYKFERDGRLKYEEFSGEQATHYLNQYTSWIKSEQRERHRAILRRDRERLDREAIERYWRDQNRRILDQEQQRRPNLETEQQRQQQQRHTDYALIQERAQEMRENGLPSSTQPQPTDNLPPAVDAPFESDTCAICMDPIGKVNCVTIRCGHQFCGDCIFHHLQMAKGTCCPMCRKEYAVRPPQYIPSQRHNVGELPMQVPQQLMSRSAQYNPAQHNNVGELPIQRPRPRPRPSGRPRPTNI